MKTLFAAALVATVFATGSASAQCVIGDKAVTCGQYAAVYEAQQDEVDRRAAIRARSPQPVEVWIKRPMAPAADRAFR